MFKKIILSATLSLFSFVSTAQIVNPNPPGATTWNTPGTIGSTTPNSGQFTFLTANKSLATSTTGAFSYGTLPYSDTGLVASYQASQAGYLQALINNTSNAVNASADFVVGNNLNTASTYYGDFGMNSSTFTGSGALNVPNAVYLTGTTGDLVLGTTTSNAMHLLTNSATTDAITISAANIPTLNSPILVTPAIGTPASGVITNLSGTCASCSIGGNAATATTATSATTATTATNIAGGAANSIPYQTGAGATGMIAAGTNGYVLQMVAGSPQWANSSGVFNPAAVAITGGTINGTTIGATTPSTGAFNSVVINPATQTMTELQVGSGSTTLTGLYLGNDTNNYGGIWSTAVTPNTSNYAFAAGSTQTILNAATTTSIQIAASSVITVTADTAAIKGTGLASNATTGIVGEVASVTQASIAAPSTSVSGNCTSLLLSAGDWDIYGGIYVTTNGAIITVGGAGINSTSASLPPTYYQAGFSGFTNTGGGTVPTQRAIITSPTTYYLVTNMQYTGGPPTMTCNLFARRAR